MRERLFPQTLLTARFRHKKIVPSLAITILTFLILFVNTSFAQPQLHWLHIEDFSGGLNSDVQSWKIADNEATDLLNVYVDEIEEGVAKRKGYAKANSTTTTSNSWLQSTTTDWNAGTLVNIDTYTASGTFRLKTSYWTQTSASDFASGTLVNIDTTTASGTFRVAKTTEAINQQNAEEPTSGASVYGAMWRAQSFKPSVNCILTKVKIYCAKTGTLSNTTIYLKSDNNNSPGDTMTSKVVSSGDFGIDPNASWVTVNFPDTELTTSTRYWIYWSHPSGDDDNYFCWKMSNDVYADGNVYDNGGPHTGYDLTFKVYEQHYESSGNLLSQTGDLGIKPESWGNFTATQDLNGRTIDWYIQTSSSSDMSSPTGWVAVTNNTTPSVTLNRYVQWKSVLNASGNATPIVYDVTINGKITGSLTSQYHDCTDVVQWGRLEANHTLNEQTITYAVRTSSYSAGLSTATWYAVESGDNITAPVNRYVQWISTLTSTGSQTPIVNNVTIYWYSTPISVFSYPITSLHRLKKSDGSEYMWAVSTGTIYGSADAGTFSSVKTGMSTTYDVNWTNMGDYAYCVDGSTWAQTFTAYDSCTAVTTVPRGRFIIEEGYRLWVGYAVGYPSRLYYESNLADATTWEWVYIPGEGEITGLGKLQGSVIVYKPTSVWKVIGVQVSSEEDVYFVPALVNLSSEVGCINHRSIQNFRLKGYTVQLFLGKDSVYATNGVGVTPVGDKIENTIEDLKQASFASSYSWLETLFTTGTPVNVDTTTVLGTIRLNSGSWEETTTAHFGVGVTKTNIDTSNNEIKLQISDEAINQQQTVQVYWVDTAVKQAQSFKPSINCISTKVSVYIKRIGSPANITFYLKADNNNSPGSTLASKTVNSGSVGTSFSWIDFNWANVNLTKDVKYWIYTPVVGSPGNFYIWGYTTGNPYARGNGWDSYNGNRASVDYCFKIYEQHYPTSGYFRSQEKDLTISSAFGKFYESHSGSGITFKARRYSSGSWSSFVTVTDDTKINLSAGTKVQYDITLTGTVYATPKVYDVKIDYFTASGNFTSQYHDCGTQITNWGNFVPNHTLNGQTISYQVRSSTWSGAVDGTSWYDVVPNGLIPCLVNRYVQWKATLTTDDGTEIPVIDDVTIYWWAGAFSGSSPASVVYDDRYHLFAMTSGSNFNDIDLVLNEDGAWTKNNIEAGSAVIYNEKLYTGSSTTTANGSWIYEQDIGYSDDLQAINSYWQSKDYDLGIPYKDKTLRKIWTVTKREGAYPLKLEYIMDLNKEVGTYDILLDGSECVPPSTIGIVPDERHIPSSARAKFFSFKVSNNGENEPWELYRIDCGFQPSPGMSEP